MDKKFKSRPRNAYKKQCLQIKKIIKNHYPVEDVFGIEKYVMLETSIEETEVFGRMAS